MPWFWRTWRLRRQLRERPPIDPVPELIVWTVNLFLFIVIVNIVTGGH